MCGMSDEIPLDCSKFESWLTSKDEQIWVGTASSEDCPLAMFVTEQTNYLFVFVTNTLIVWQETKLSNASHMPLPKWAKDFVSALDFDEAGINQRSWRKVTAIDALNTLRRITDVAL
jgi:hypothetical protein